jgi:hypothetical protein
LELLRTWFARAPQDVLGLLNTLFLAEIADALGRDGKSAEGIPIIDEALARSERNEERWCVAELLRIKGELILQEGAPQAATAAEEHFLKSLDWARRQGGQRPACAVPHHFFLKVLVGTLRFVHPAVFRRVRDTPSKGATFRAVKLTALLNRGGRLPRSRRQATKTAGKKKRQRRAT